MLALEVQGLAAIGEILVPGDVIVFAGPAMRDYGIGLRRRSVLHGHVRYESENGLCAAIFSGREGRLLL